MPPITILPFAALALFLSSSALSAANLPPPVHLTSEQDHQRTMDLLHIKSLRPGADRDSLAVVQNERVRQRLSGGMSAAPN
jgi:hypothetical protein